MHEIQIDYQDCYSREEHGTEIICLWPDLQIFFSLGGLFIHYITQRGVRVGLALVFTSGYTDKGVPSILHHTIYGWDLDNVL
jgi:hypothetical protein